MSTAPWKTALEGQTLAAIEMLENAIRTCPPRIWDDLDTLSREKRRKPAKTGQILTQYALVTMLRAPVYCPAACSSLPPAGHIVRKGARHGPA
jgi:hypothetical protein